MQYFSSWKRIKPLPLASLSTHHFLKGNYIYVGSAKKNLLARVKRHIQVENYLTGILTTCARMGPLLRSKTSMME